VTDRKEMFVRKSSEKFPWILYKRIKKSLWKIQNFIFSWNLSSKSRNRKSSSARRTLCRAARFVADNEKFWNRSGLYATRLFPSSKCHEIVPNCPQIDGHPRFLESLSTTTRGRGGCRSAGPPRDVERVRVHRAHTPGRIWIQLHLIVPRCL